MCLRDIIKLPSPAAFFRNLNEAAKLRAALIRLELVASNCSPSWNLNEVAMPLWHCSAPGRPPGLVACKPEIRNASEAARGQMQTVVLDIL
jgi:hypothetical protein